MTAVRLGMFYFPTKSAAHIYLRDLLHQSPLHETIVGLNHSILTHAYRLHPNRDHSIPILRHAVGWNYVAGGRSRGFHTFLATGEYDTWSYRAPLSPWSDAGWWDEAARNTWLPHARDWKRERGGRCQGCGSLEASDVHHMPPWEFKQIVTAFAAENKLDVAKIGGLLVLVERGAFIAFHNQRANLRLLCKPCHGRERKWRHDEEPHRTIKRS